MAHGDAVLHAVYGAFWAMEETKYLAMLEVLDRWSDGVRLSAEEIQARVGPARRQASAPAGSGVAILPIFGLMSHRAHLVQDISGPGGTSTELVGRDFDAAMADPDVGTIVLDIDSPGGNVAGVQELAAKIHAARGQKRVVAVANSLAASAAYWVGAAAEEFVVTPSGEVGSIGVFAVHTDTSRRDKGAGVDRTVLKAGRRKAEGNPYEPLGSDARAYIEQQLGEYYEAFTSSIAEYRKVTADVARSERFGEGRTLTARRALAQGLVDRIATMETVLAELGISATAKPQPMRGGRSAAQEILPIAASVSGDAPAARTFDLPSVIVHPAATQGVSVVKPVPLVQAKEHLVTAPTTAAQEIGATTIHPAQAELDRQTRIRELASLVPSASAAEVDQLIRSNASVEEARTKLQARVGAPAPINVRVTGDPADQKFRSFGEQLVAIVQAGKPDGRRDPRLTAINAVAAASGMNESVGSEGGYFIQNDLLPGVITPVYEEDPLLSRVKRIPIGAGKNGIKYLVVDETARTHGSRWGGIQMYWASEAGTVAAKQPKTRLMSLDLKKVMGIGYLTEELMEDAPASESLLTDAFQGELRFMLGDAIFRGPGGGQPLGFLPSAATVAQAIEGTQSIANSATFIAANTSKMLSRMPAGLWGEAIWLYNPELLPTLVQATVGGTAAVPVFLPPNGMAGRPFGSIWGIPAFPSELCEAIGTPGDLVLIAPSQYHMAEKSAGANVATSVHVRFLYDEQTLKITYRVDGAPLWTSAVTPYKGAATRSAYITLATRS